MSVEDLPDDPFALDPDKGTIQLIVGMKGSGKSVFARRQYHAWQHDKLCIDPTGDADPGPDAERLTTEQLATKFPVQTEITGPPKPRNLHFRPSPRSATFRQEVDKAIGMSLFPADRKTLVWVDEWGTVSRPSSNDPNAQLLLMQSRHHGPVSALLCCPRPININVLSRLQADGVAIFRVPSIKDRQTLVDQMDLELDEFEELYQANRERGPHAFLFYHAPSGVLLDCPPLPHGAN